MGVQALAHKYGYRGDSVANVKDSLDGNVVETFMSGNTTIVICDDSVVQTDHDIQMILKKYHEAGWAILRSLSSQTEGKPC